MRKSDILAAVVAHLEANPADFQEFVTAVGAGLQGALARAHEANTRSDQAMMAALLLADEKRIGAELRQTLLERIAGAIRKQNASPVERKFLALAQDLQKDREGAES